MFQMISHVDTNYLGTALILYLGHHFQSGSALDQVSSVLVLDHDASLGRVT